MEAAAALAALALRVLLLARPGPGARLERGAAETFLKKYGYFDEPGPRGPSPAQFTEAVREFQWVTHLPRSGVLDASTVHKMSLPRCGVSDAESHAAWAERVRALLSGGRGRTRRGKRYAQHGGKWYTRHLTYRIVNWPEYLPQHQVQQVVKAAFNLWSNVSALVFWEVPEGPADIRLAFFHGDHNDGLSNAFDGPGGALAHAFFPRRGEAHFDSAERWSLHSGKGRNLFVVVAHEIGHTLGLEHSPVRTALMSPYYKKLGKDFVLSWDDILAVQNLYGKPSRGSAVRLPGTLFAHFHGWSPGFPGNGQLQGSLGSYYCQSSFDAITIDADHNLYVFKGHHYWVVEKGGKATEPQLLQTRWAELPAGIDAAAMSEAGGKFYFFKGSRCWRYNGSSLEEGFPQKCSTSNLPRHPDAALYFQQLRHLVLFKGPKYYVVSEETLQVEPYYPRSLRDWNGVPAGVNGALTQRDGFVYFFRDDRYWKFDQAKLQVVVTGKWAAQLSWIGCWDRNSSQTSF
ncbi:matrix metalloproteinase-28 [Carettochelys insculpta]|uniref:matrix metalloproteinase-28 n=1 Tax=Carettochelys insculpta TaxID=44489 RepID=UPI003EC02479